MLRDFSDQTKQELLSLVKQVENDKWSDFTDWIGDRWYDFEDLIGELNIKNYVNNVNEYHKKVIDKNNATASSIEKIFNDVKAADSTYAVKFSGIENSLNASRNYIESLAEIINPSAGKFTVSNIANVMNKEYNNIENSNVEVYKNLFEQNVNGKWVVDYELVKSTLYNDDDTMSEAERTALNDAISHVDRLVAMKDIVSMDKTDNKALKNAYRLLLCLKYNQIVTIVQKGNHFIIKGGVCGFLEDSEISDLEKIKGTKYRIGSDAFNESGLKYFVPTKDIFSKGAQKFLSNIKEPELWKSSFKEFKTFKGGIQKIYGFEKNDTFTHGLNNFGKVLGYASIALDTGAGLKEDIDNKATASHTIGDATANVAKGLGAMAVATGCAQVGAAIGTAIPIPGVGTAVGALVGFGLGWLGSQVYDYAIDGAKIGGKTVKQWAACGVENACNVVGNAATSAAKGIQNVGKAAEKKLDAAANAVGNFFGGIGKAVAVW